MKYPQIAYTKNIGFNNNNNFHKLNEIGLNNAYSNDNKVYVKGETMYIAGTSDLKDAFDDISKIPFYGDIKNSTRYNQAKKLLETNPQVQNLTGHSLGASIALQLQKDNSKYHTTTYGAPVLQLNPFTTGNRYRFKNDPISMFDNGAITIDSIRLNPHSYKNIDLN